MNTGAKILVVDDCLITQGIVRGSLQAKYKLSMAGSLAEARQELGKSTPHLIVLDIGLPDGDGLKFAVELRQTPILQRIPLIFLTGKGEPADKVLGFTVGADDYMVKPLEPLEFVARIENQLRKTREMAEVEEGYEKSIFRVSSTQQKIFLRKGGEFFDLKLTTNEFKLLNHFLRHESHVLSREQILNSVWGSDAHVTDRTVDSHVYSIRKKLGDYADCIQSVPRAGYRFSLETNRLKTAV